MEMSPENKELGIFIIAVLAAHGLSLYYFLDRIIRELRAVRLLLERKEPPPTGDADT